MGHCVLSQLKSERSRIIDYSGDLRLLSSDTSHVEERYERLVGNADTVQLGRCRSIGDVIETLEDDRQNASTCNVADSTRFWIREAGVFAVDGYMSVTSRTGNS